MPEINDIDPILPDKLDSMEKIEEISYIDRLPEDQFVETFCMSEGKE